MDELNDDVPVLRLCRLVSRSWNEAFTPFAFRHTTVLLADKKSQPRGHSHMSHVYKCVSRYSPVSKHIRHIDFHDRRALTGDGMDSVLEMHDLLHVLLSLPKLEQLTFRGRPSAGHRRLCRIPHAREHVLNAVRFDISESDRCQSLWSTLLAPNVYNLLCGFLAIDTLVVAKNASFHSVALEDDPLKRQIDTKSHDTGNMGSLPYVVRALELEDISLCIPHHDHVKCYTHNSHWLPFLQSLRIATLDAGQTHCLSSFLRCTKRLRTLDVGMFVSQAQGKTKDLSGDSIGKPSLQRVSLRSASDTISIST